MNQTDAAAIRAEFAATITRIAAAQEMQPEFDQLVTKHTVIPVPIPKPTIYPLGARQLCLRAQHPAPEKYKRGVENLLFTTDKIECIQEGKGVVRPLQFQCLTSIFSGATGTFASPMYKLLVDGVERGRVTVVPGVTKIATFTGAMFGDERDGPVLLTIQPCNADGTPDTRGIETNAPHAVTINRTGKAKDVDWVYAQRSTWDWSFAKLPHAIVKLPLTWFKAKALPLKQQPAVEFNTTLAGAGPNLTRVLLAPQPNTNSLQNHHLLTRLDGSMHTDCYQGYPPDYYMDFYRLPNRDGERNIADFYHLTGLVAGRLQKWYGHTYVSFVRINADGRRITLWGPRHKYAPDQLEAKKGGPAEEFVGTTSDPRLTGPDNHRIPGGWGFDWDWLSLMLNFSAPPIGGDPPHIGRTRWLLVEERGYFMEIAGNGSDPNRSNPDPATWFPHDAKVIAEGFNVPRGFAHRRGTREGFISETGANRITRVNIDTGAVIDYLIDNPSAAQYGYTPQYGPNNQLNGPYYRRFTSYGKTVDALRLLNIHCIAPEGGVYYTDVDGEWYAWINRATMQVVRVNVVTKQWQLVGNVTSLPDNDPGNQVTQLCVNDNIFTSTEPDGSVHHPRGGFGRHGTLFVVHFGSTQLGNPQTFEPVASTGVVDTATSALTNGYTEVNSWYQPYSYDTDAGRGPGWSNSVYPTAVGAGYGQLAVASCVSGLAVYRKATANDPKIDRAANQRGAAYFRSMAYDLLSHTGGPAFPNDQWPWGENVDMDKWGQAEGLVKP